MRTILGCGLHALLLAMAMSVALRAQTSAAAPGPIQDNGFLIEEAYNQEPGVVQHISSFSYLTDSQDWVYSFTQEWPLPWDWRHQVSYSMAAVRPVGSGAGLGDLAINYRYQLVGDGDSPVAVAPRFSLLLPTGDSDADRGAGAVGYQVNLPASIALGRRLVSHLNAGGTVIPNASNSAGDTARVKGYNLGASLIALAHPSFNVMLETLWTGQGSVTGDDLSEFGHSLFVSPGIRWAYNLQSGLQIVPGMAYAQGLGPSSDERAIILYLSFEHPFRRTD